MPIKINGINTPFGGISWDNIEDKKRLNSLQIPPVSKIKVYISSIHGVKKYKKARKELKKSIEATQLADVYICEERKGFIFSKKVDYKFSLEESDICIFLIDNVDGVTPDVQAEIDIVKKNNIKAIYYFCDEKRKEKTELELSLISSKSSSSITIHSFDELGHDGARVLLENIIMSFHFYCKGIMIEKNNDMDEIGESGVVGSERYQLPTIPKSTLKNVDKCSDYILNFVLGESRIRYNDEVQKTSEFDEWGLQFLPILFEGKNIRNFNTSMYLETLKTQQDDAHYQVVKIRWKAIQAYFADDIEKCIENLEKALEVAREIKLPTWIIKDILIDLRNVNRIRGTMNNCYFEITAQKELSESNEELYYPILDRIHDSLHEKYIEGLYKKQIESPYTVTLASSLDRYGEMLASSLIISMYNGSLTHILLIYEKMKDFIFYLSCKYSDWSIKYNLYKLAIFEGSEKEIKGIEESYAEILNNLTSSEALLIMEFCENQPIKYKKLNNYLLAFGSVGYFLDDASFKKYETFILKEINEWLEEDKIVVAIGQNIFKCLSGIAYRISQDTLSEICCRFIDNHYSRWYRDMFKLIDDYIDLRKMSDTSARLLIEHIIMILDHEKEREQLKYKYDFLCKLRKQNTILTDTMDKKIKQYFPEFYKSNYKLLTTENKIQDYPIFVSKYVEQIKKNNEMQGKNGLYFERAIRDIAIIREILLENEIIINNQVMDELINAVAETILISRESISTKIDAVSLLACVVLRYPEDYKRNQEIFNKLFNCQDDIYINENTVLSSNIDVIALKISLQFLFVSMDKDVYTKILELMPCIQDDIATIITVTSFIAEYLETTDFVVLPSKIESIVLQNVLQWVHFDQLDVRWHATRILLTLSRNLENSGIIKCQLINLIDSDVVHVKNLILRKIHKLNGINDDVKEYIISKCKQDVNFLVRMVCKEIEEK